MSSQHHPLINSLAATISLANGYKRSIEHRIYKASIAGDGPLYVLTTMAVDRKRKANIVVHFIGSRQADVEAVSAKLAQDDRDDCPILAYMNAGWTCDETDGCLTGAVRVSVGGARVLEHQVQKMTLVAGQPLFVLTTMAWDEDRKGRVLVHWLSSIKEEIESLYPQLSAENWSVVTLMAHDWGCDGADFCLTDTTEILLLEIG